MKQGAAQPWRCDRGATLLALITLVACCVTNGSTWGAVDELIGAASDRHLWLVLEPRGKSAFYDLVHHPSDEEGWFYRTQHTMTQPPAAMAAIDDAIWLVMPARKLGDDWRREVFTASVEKNPATGLYYTVPAGRLEMMTALEGLGRLAGFVATSRGPVALILPAPRSAAAVPVPSATEPQPSLDRPVLLRLSPGEDEWSEIALPHGFIGSRSARLGVASDRLIIFDATADNPERSTLHVQIADGGWETSSHPFDARDVQSLTQVAGQLVASGFGRSDANRLEFMFLRPSGPLVLGSIEQPESRWAALGFDGRLAIVERERGSEDEPAFSVRTIDPLTAAVSVPMAFTRQPLTAGRMWQLTLALGLSLSAVLAIILLRPPPAGAIKVDPQAVLPASRRITALLIDLIIASVPTMLLLDCPPADLLRLPMLSNDFERGGPYLWLVLIMSAINTSFECVIGRSPGKMLAGGRLASLDGSRVATWRVLIRGVLRLMVLLVPPLGVLAFTNSHMQGLPDLAARTLVLVSPPRSADESEDRPS